MAENNNISEDDLLSAFGLSSSGSTGTSGSGDGSLDPNALIDIFANGASEVRTNVERIPANDRDREREAQLEEKRLRSQQWKRELDMQKEKAAAMREESAREQEEQKKAAAAKVAAANAKAQGASRAAKPAGTVGAQDRNARISQATTNAARAKTDAMAKGRSRVVETTPRSQAAAGAVRSKATGTTSRVQASTPAARTQGASSAARAQSQSAAVRTQPASTVRTQPANATARVQTATRANASSAASASSAVKDAGATSKTKVQAKESSAPFAGASAKAEPKATKANTGTSQASSSLPGVSVSQSSSIATMPRDEAPKRQPADRVAQTQETTSSIMGISPDVQVRAPGKAPSRGMDDRAPRNMEPGPKGSPLGVALIIIAVLCVLVAVSLLTGLWDISNL